MSYTDMDDMNMSDMEDPDTYDGSASKKCKTNQDTEVRVFSYKNRGYLCLLGCLPTRGKKTFAVYWLKAGLG